MAIDFYKGLLHRILCVLDLSQHRERDPKHTSLVVPYESLKGLSISAEDGLNQAQILCGRVRVAVLRRFCHLQKMGSVVTAKRFKGKTKNRGLPYRRNYFIR